MEKKVAPITIKVPKPRNPFGRVPVAGKAGSHRSSNKSKRLQNKRDLSQQTLTSPELD